MRIPAHTRHGENHQHFCARCLSEVQAGAACCPGCKSPFSGAGRFDLMVGPPPSPVFQSLFSSES